MRTLTRSQGADETATNGIELTSQSVPYETRNLASWSYLNPYNTVEASAAAQAPTFAPEALQECPDWARTALRTDAWGFWADTEEDIYSADDGQPL